jgi:hypothetical protein
MSKKKKNTDATKTIALNRRILGANAKYREAVALVNELQLELASRSSLEKIQKIITPHKYQVIKSNNREATAVIVCSDWHIDEIVDSSEINYLNEFNLNIAEKRAETFFSHTIKLLELYRNDSKIDTVVFAALGDFISGWIHPELIESSLMTPPEALIQVYELLLGGLKFLIDKGQIKELIFIGCCGNHGRITTKPRHKKMVKKSYAWLLYEFLARKLANTKYSKVIKFKLPKGYFNYLTIYDRLIRFHHGDNVRYQGGVGGIHIPLRKAIAQWNKGTRVDLDVMGHWHTRETSEDYVLNGSLIGWNTFAESIKADFRKPQQAFFLIHPEYGKTSECKIVLE